MKMESDVTPDAALLAIMTEAHWNFHLDRNNAGVRWKRLAVSNRQEDLLDMAAALRALADGIERSHRSEDLAIARRLRQIADTANEKRGEDDE